MIFRNLIFQLEVIKQRLLAGFASHHEQASKANREQQHRVLWPAYNPNLAPRQASNEGLFQQTRLFSSVDVYAIDKVSSSRAPTHRTHRKTNQRPSSWRSFAPFAQGFEQSHETFIEHGNSSELSVPTSL